MELFLGFQLAILLLSLIGALWGFLNGQLETATLSLLILGATEAHSKWLLPRPNARVVFLAITVFTYWVAVLFLPSNLFTEFCALLTTLFVATLFFLREQDKIPHNFYSYGPNVSGDLPKSVQLWVASEIGQKDKPLPIKDKLVSLIPSQVDREIARLQEEAAGQDWEAFLQTRFNTTNLVEYFGRPFVQALINYNNRLPYFLGEKGLETKLENVPHWDAIEAFYSAFKREDDKLYWDTIWLLSHNRKMGVYQSADGKLYDWGSSRFYENLTNGLPFGELFRSETPVKVKIPQKYLMQTTWCIAPQGRGKTTVLSSLIKSQLDEVKNGSASIIVMDAKGELTELKRAAMFQEGGELEGRLSFIEPWRDLALNPFVLPGAHDEEKVSEGIRYLLNSILETGTTELMRPIISRAVMAVRKHPKPSLEVLMDLLSSDAVAYEREIKQLPKKHSDWFFRFWNEADIQKSRMAAARRIDTLLMKSERMSDMFLADRTRLDLKHEMDSGRVIVINNARKALGDGVEFFSRFILMLVHNAVLTRNEYSIPVYFFMDEAHLAIRNDPLAAEIITQCRANKIGMVAAHQNAEQIKDPDVIAALRGSSILLANTKEDAVRLSTLMHTSAESIRGLSEGEFMLWMYNTPGMPVIIKPSKEEHVSAWDRMSDEQWGKLEEEMRRRYCSKNTRPAPQKVDTAPVKWGS